MKHQQFSNPAAASAWTSFKALALLGPIWSLCGVPVHAAEPPTYYVNVANPTPAAPYTSWETAATNIQQAIDAGGEVGRLVLVTNGVYRTGSVTTNGLNRVVLPESVTVRSVNGPQVTVIEGAPAAGGGLGNGAIRCAYVGTNAVLSGFTLTNGYTRGEGWPQWMGGGALCNSSAVLTNCVLTGNSADSGGGVSGGTLHGCILSGNLAYRGGGAYECTLYDCTLTGNSAHYCGGGASGGALHNCTLSGNSAVEGGGGALGGTLYNCTLTGNAATGSGGWGGGA